jgi:2-dehydro-3-deoxyphosphogalactonate aldolase
MAIERKSSMTVQGQWQRMLTQMPLVAILRSLKPAEALDVAGALKDAGFLCLEVPLNSPDPFTSIKLLTENFGDQLLIGTGTVLTEQDVEASQRAGAQFIVSPDVNAAVIRATKSMGLISFPGFATPSEAFTALDAGADALKLFPAEAAPPAVLRAMKAVLPEKCPVFPVGGIGTENMADYYAAGAAGFGIGSAIYKSGVTAPAVRERADTFVQAWRNLRR